MELQERVVVVLVRARNPGNIGAVARAMHDFGYAELRVVNEFRVPFAAAIAAEKAAVDAGSVLKTAAESATVADAVADCTLVIGTTAVGERVLEHPLHTLAKAVDVVRLHLAGHADAKVALLFGSEKTGLSNEELSYCHALLTIPMRERDGDRHLSMNLGQAVAVCLYCLAQDDAHVEKFEAPERGASGADMERITAMLLSVMEASGYSRRHPANVREANVRRMAMRMGLNANDAQVWTGVWRQILYALARGGRDESDSDESKL